MIFLTKYLTVNHIANTITNLNNEIGILSKIFFSCVTELKLKDTIGLLTVSKLRGRK